MRHHKKTQLYLPWGLYDGEDEDDWVAYLDRTLNHPTGELSPYPDTAWKLSSDEDGRLHAAVMQAFYRTPELDASHIRILVNYGTVVLSGRVGTLREKAHAEEIVKQLHEVWRVENRLKLSE